jgi:hypothetical protein
MATQKYLCKCKFGKFGGILACLAILDCLASLATLVSLTFGRLDHFIQKMRFCTKNGNAYIHLPNWPYFCSTILTLAKLAKLPK